MKPSRFYETSRESYFRRGSRRTVCFPHRVGKISRQRGKWLPPWIERFMARSESSHGSANSVGVHQYAAGYRSPVFISFGLVRALHIGYTDISGKKSAFYVTTVKSGGYFWPGRIRDTWAMTEILSNWQNLIVFYDGCIKDRSYARDIACCIVWDSGLNFEFTTLVSLAYFSSDWSFNF